ncbi:hypothetical protein [Sphingomonas sp. PL20]
MIARGRWPFVEYALMLAVLASVGRMAMFFHANHYLPAPFVFDTNDTFMDWFNTAFWANRPGAYDVWRSIYPPLSFVFLDLASLPGCYRDSPFHARDCDWVGRSAIGALYLIDVILLWIAFRRNDRRTAIPRTAAFAVGLPLLYTLERGNLILAGFAAFIVAYGPVTRSPLARAVANAVAINFKPYLVLGAFAHAVRREWRPLEYAGFATVALYLVTLALVGAGTPAEIVANTANWVTFQTGQVWGEIAYSTSYAPLLLVRASQMPVLDFVPSRLIEGIEVAVPIVIRSTQAVAALCLAAAWLQPGALERGRLAAILLGTYFVTQSPGGYTQTFLLFLVFLERGRGIGPTIAIMCAYALSLVFEWPLSTIMEVPGTSWLGGTTVLPRLGLALGHFIRPGLIAAIVWALALDGLAQVVRAHRDTRPSLGLAVA